MAGYKHIERRIGTYIVAHYKNPVEVGIGKNVTAARIIRDANIPLRCTDIRSVTVPAGMRFLQDDIFSPEHAFYAGSDVIYAIRPAEEMVPPLIALAETISCDLLVYHLGFESYGSGGELIDCGEGVLLHRYHGA